MEMNVCLSESDSSDDDDEKQHRMSAKENYGHVVEDKYLCEPTCPEEVEQNSQKLVQLAQNLDNEKQFWEESESHHKTETGDKVYQRQKRTRNTSGSSHAKKVCSESR